MSIEIRQLLIKSQVVQRHPDEQGGVDSAASPAADETDWRAECRRLIVELLDERKER